MADEIKSVSIIVNYISPFDEDGNRIADENGNPIPLYSEEEIKAAKAQVKGKTELDALVAYLQSLGHALK